MQNRPGHEKVGIDLGIEGCGSHTDADEGEDVLEQTADPGMMQDLGRWRYPVGRGDRRIVKEGEDEAA